MKTEHLNRSLRMRLNTVLVLFSMLVLTSCGSGGGSDNTVEPVVSPQNDIVNRKIFGRVIDELSRIPIEGATIKSEPATRTVTTDSSGYYELIEQLVDGQQYRIIANVRGYSSKLTTVSLTDSTQADFSLTPNVLVVDKPVVQFDSNNLQVAIKLSSPNDTDYTVMNSHNWLSALPASGSLKANQPVYLTVAIDDELAPIQKLADAQISINSTTGVEAVAINVISYLGAELNFDVDNDGIANLADNCPFKANTAQIDSDADGLGDACDAQLAVDRDGDGIRDTEDNCPDKSNSSQQDSDSDGMGDVCDASPVGDEASADNPADTPTEDPADGGSEGEGGTVTAEGKVDCNFQYPCSWTSDDGGIEFRLTNADENTDGKQVIYLSVTTTRDSELTFHENSAVALSESSTVYNDEYIYLGNIGSEGDVTNNSFAGLPLAGYWQMDQNAPSGRGKLLMFEFSVSEGEVKHTLQFINLATGPQEVAAVDCAQTVPCTWVSRDGEFTVVVTEVTKADVNYAGYKYAPGLIMYVTFTASRDMNVIMNIGALGAKALLDSGDQLLNIHQRIAAGAVSKGLLTHTALSGYQVTAVQWFYATSWSGDYIARLELSLYENVPKPRYLPVFLNVPLAEVAEAE